MHSVTLELMLMMTDKESWIHGAKGLGTNVSAANNTSQIEGFRISQMYEDITHYPLDDNMISIFI